MNFSVITTETQLEPKDIIREPHEKRLYQIVDIDVTFERLMVKYATIEHISDEDRKIMLYKDSLYNKWEKLVN